MCSRVSQIYKNIEGSIATEKHEQKRIYDIKVRDSFNHHFLKKGVILLINLFSILPLALYLIIV